MKLKNKDLAEIISSISSLSQEKLPIKTAWKLETIRKSIFPLYETLQITIDERKKAKALRDKEGNFILARDAQGNELPNTMTFDRKDIEELNKEILSVMDEEVEVSNVGISVEDFPDTLLVSMDSIRGLSKVTVE